MKLQQLYRASSEVLDYIGRDGLCSSLAGLVLMCNKLVENNVAPIADKLKDCESIKLVTDQNAFKSSGAGKVYNVMGFKLKVYTYGVGKDKARLVALVSKDSASIEGIWFNGGYYDSISIVSFDDADKFTQMMCSGPVSRVKVELDREYPLCAYKTRVVPNCLRFAVLMDKSQFDVNRFEAILAKHDASLAAGATKPGQAKSEQDSVVSAAESDPDFEDAGTSLFAGVE